MKEFFATIKRQLKDYIDKLDKKRKIIWLTSIVAIIAIAIILAAFLGKTEYTVLYSGMKEEDAGSVAEMLDERGVEYKTEGSGTILVPVKQADKLRMELAKEGFPKSGLNYDIFQNASGFGKTDMEQETYKQYQLQDNLASTIKQFEGVEDATVLITLGDDSPFVISGTNRKASAAVMLNLKEDEPLPNESVVAIGELVEKSVPDLTLDEIWITDSQMNSYDLTKAEDQAEYTTSQWELQQKVRDDLQDQVVKLLTPVFGTGKVQAMVNVSLNFDKTKTQSVEFAPPVDGSEDGIAVGIKELTEVIKDDAAAEGEPGVDPNVGVPSYPEVEVDENNLYTKVSREANLEINETKTEIDTAQGQIEDLSIAVIIDENEEAAEDYTENVTDLISNALGIDPEFITVENLPFTEETKTMADLMADQEAEKEKEDLAKLIRWVIFGVTVTLVAALIFLFFRKKQQARIEAQTAEQLALLRAEEDARASELAAIGLLLDDEKLEKKLKEKEDEEKAEDEEKTRGKTETTERKKITTAIIDPKTGEPLSEEELSEMEDDEIEELEEIAIAKEKMKGPVKKVEKFIEKDPEAVAQLLRNWLTND